MAFDLKVALGTIAPTLATMLGGPLAGAAVSALTTALGLKAGAGIDEITKVVQAGQLTPETIAAMRKADQEHAEKLRQMEIDVQRLASDHEAAMASIDASDRDSARKREMAVRGLTTPTLAWIVVGASVVLGSAIVLGEVTKDPTQATLVGTVIGYVFSEAKQVLSYYFGSSAGSAHKTELLAQANPIQSS